MDRRQVLWGAAFLLPSAARAHHGWSGFDQDRPLYLEGVATAVRWRNPHAELDLTPSKGLALPADLAQRPVPAQSSPVDAPKLMSTARLPRKLDTAWRIELAPLTRLEAWQVPTIANGAAVAVLGFAKADEAETVLRAEYLFLNGKAFGLRSSPA